MRDVSRRVTGIALDIVWEDKKANQANLSDLLAANSPGAGALVVLPEMWATGFSRNVPAITETFACETAAFMAAHAKQYGIYLMGGMVTTGPDGRGRNVCVVYDPEGTEIAHYIKMHPFSFGLENEAYGRGSEVVLFEWSGVTVAPFICYDLRFPEVFRQAVRQGAELFCVIANWPEVRDDHWLTLLRARAIENQAFIIGVNRSGNDPNCSYSGHSVIYGPRGERIAEGGRGEATVSAWLDMPGLHEYRREFPALDDIHPNFR